MKKVYRNISALITNEGIVKKRGRNINADDLGIINNAALVFDDTRGVLWFGKDSRLPREFKVSKRGGKVSTRAFDCSGLVSYPGLVDCHTHPAFAGDRSQEFELRMQGASYQEISAAGGGINFTVEQTRKCPEKKLKELVSQRFENAKKFGVALLEAKSGYGLSLKHEIASLRAIQAASKETKDLKVLSTCLAAHAIPREYKENRSAYIELVLKEILPAARKYAEYCDVFSDFGFFSSEETSDIFTKAQQLGFQLRLHGDELANTESAKLAVTFGAKSVDHLLKISKAGIDALALSKTVAVLLPATSFYLKEEAAPARALLDRGGLVAIATDFNPGTSPTQNLPFVGSLAAILLKMTTAEIINAMTFVPALSLDQENHYGALLPGYQGRPCFAFGEHPSAIFYQLANGSLPVPGSH